MDKTANTTVGSADFFSIPKWIKWTLYGLGILVLLLFAGYLSMAWYINTHKKQVLASLTTQLNENLNGEMSIGSMEPTFLEDFPNVSLDLKNVAIKDSLYEHHRHLFLKADDFFIALNPFALLRGTVQVKKITVSDAAVDLFTDRDGYSNGSVFAKEKSEPGSGKGSLPELKMFLLKDVVFNVENLKSRKKYHFEVGRLKGNIVYNPSGWNADVQLETLVKSMTFSIKNGSFIKDKTVEGGFEISYNSARGVIVFAPNELRIGGEDFTVAARFETKTGAGFEIHIRNESILWSRASGLLSPNISAKLNMFDLAEPITVSCDLKGDFDAEGDPLIAVHAAIKDNVLQTPGGRVTNCSFNGEFTNNFKRQNGFTDANSAIKLSRFQGEYQGIPFKMNSTFIIDFDNPIIKGDFHSMFPIDKLNNLIDTELLVFTKGNAEVQLNYTADIVNFMIAKPLVEGSVAIRDADVKYIPRKLDFDAISVNLNFKKEDLFISNIHLKSGKSEVNMKGSIHNFLNLYYTAPEKIVLNWDIKSPQLHLGEFLGFLGSRKIAPTAKKKPKHGNFTDDINLLFEKSNVNMTFNVDKVFYNRFYATNAAGKLLLTDSGIVIKRAGLSHAGGTLNLEGSLLQQGAMNRFSIDATASHVGIRKFFEAFSNFGLESLKSDNLSGLLSAKAKLSGRITDKGIIVPKAMQGDISFAVKNGELLHFTPIKSAGKFAFPFRNLDAISFYDLKGNFGIRGEKVIISPMQINSSVLNMDIEGVYSFGKGTRIYIAVPLRNPKKDKDITDSELLAKRRNRGIVVRLIAADGDDGKVKISLGSKKNSNP